MLYPVPASASMPAASQSKRRLFLHIGAPKTGTTSLQYYLYENRELFKERGYLYPTGLNLTMAKAHHPLYFAIASTWWHPDFYTDINSERLPAGTYRPAYDLDDCMRELRYAAANSENLILSSEGFFCLDENGVQTLCNVLSAFDVSIVVYLRRQDQFIEAMYRHFVFDSGARFRMPVAQYIDNGGAEHCDYLEKVDLWAAHFGAENITVIPYQSSSLKDGDVVCDFLERIGVLDDDGLPSSRRVNQSQPNDILGALSIANLAGWECREDAADYGRFLREHFDSNREVVPLLSRSQAIEFLDRFAKDNQELARKYLGNTRGQLFEESYPEPSDLLPADQQHVDRERAVTLLSRSVEVLIQTPSAENAEIVLATTALFKAARNSLRRETERGWAHERELRDARLSLQRAEQSEKTLRSELATIQVEAEHYRMEAESQIENIFWLVEKHAQRADEAHAKLKAIRRSVLFCVLCVPAQRVASTIASAFRSVLARSGARRASRTQRATVEGRDKGLRYTLRHPKKAALRTLGHLGQRVRFVLRQPRKATKQFFRGSWLPTRHGMHQSTKAESRTLPSQEADRLSGNGRKAAA